MTKEKNKILKQITRGAGIIFIGTLLAYFFNFLYRLIISRYLGPANYGLIALGQMVLNIGIMLSLLGLNEGLMRYTSFYLGKKNQSKIKGTLFAVLKITLPISILVSLFIIFFSKFIANQIFNNNAFTPILIIFALIIPFNVILRTLASFFLALKKPEYNQLIKTIFRNALNLFLVIVVVLISGTVFHVSLVYLLSVIFSSILGLILLEWKIFPLLKNKIKPLYNYKKLIAFSLPLFFTGIFLNIMGWADTFFLGFFKTAKQVGIYNVAFPLAAAMGMFLTSFGQIFYPIISEMLGKKEYSQISSIFETIIRWIFILTFPVFLLVVLFPKDILKILFGKEYMTGFIALVILISAYFIDVITGPALQTLKAFKKTRFIFNLNLVIVLLNLILNILLIPAFGLEGAALATAVSIVLREIIIFFKVKSLIKFKYRFKYYIKYILSASIPLVVIYLILITFFRPYSIIELIIALAAFGSLYLVLLFLFKSFTKEDLMIMIAIEKRLGLNLKFIKKFIRRFV